MRHFFLLGLAAATYIGLDRRDALNPLKGEVGPQYGHRGSKPDLHARQGGSQPVTSRPKPTGTTGGGGGGGGGGAPPAATPKSNNNNANVPPATSRPTPQTVSAPPPASVPTAAPSTATPRTTTTLPVGNATTLGNVTRLLQTPTANNSSSNSTNSTIVTKHETLVFTDGIIWVNCNTRRPSVLVNGTTPAPTLRFQAGQRVIIRVYNRMAAQNLTIHWHGLVQRASPWSDGTPMISQWPIPPGAWFEYEMILGIDDEGTYWYHTHVGLITTQWGVFIVSPAKECSVFQIYQERVMQVGDHYLISDAQAESMLSALPFAWPGNTLTMLGGKANSTWNGNNCAWAYPVVEVDPGKLYRFRWINGGALFYQSIEVQGHVMQIIEADGSATKPVNTQTIELGIGQRLSTLIQTKSAAQIQADGQGGLYLIKIAMLWRQPQVIQYAILRYTTATTQKISTPSDGTDIGYIDLGNPPTIAGRSLDVIANTAMTIPKENVNWDDIIEPYINQNMSSNNAQFILPVHFYMQSESIGGLPTVAFQVNGRKYWEYNQTDVPYLVQIYEQQQGGQSSAKNHRLLASPTARGYDAQSDTYVLQPGDVVDIILIMEPYRYPNGSDIPNNKPDHHPFHLHSRKFWVLGRGSDSFNQQTYLSGGYNLRPKNIRRDTIPVYPNRAGNQQVASGSWGWTAIRYQASPYDSMIFPLHCHISPHLLMHMAILFTVGPADMPALLDSYKQGGYMQYNGRPYGNDSWTPTTPTWFTQGPGRAQVKAMLDQQDLLNQQNGCSPW